VHILYLALSIPKNGDLWSREWGSNPRPAVYDTAALPAELPRHGLIISLEAGLGDVYNYEIKKMTHSSIKLKEVKSWDHYWEGNGIKNKRFVYNVVASSYRRFLIRPYLNYFMKKYFRQHAKVLHAGCGGGEADMNLQNYLDITALDFSQNALKKYRIRHMGKCSILTGDVRSLKFKSSSFDGVYNLGVLEHFQKDDIEKILKGFHRVLKKDGTLVIFWPPEFGISVSFFKILVFICRGILNINNVEFHPVEVSRLRSKAEARKIFKDSGFRVIECSYGLRDLFTYVVIVAKKK
jgi:ubiquinone/menaquinone biosynthesis C-methylase UbiE